MSLKTRLEKLEGQDATKGVQAVVVYRRARETESTAIERAIAESRAINRDAVLYVAVMPERSLRP